MIARRCSDGTQGIVEHGCKKSLRGDGYGGRKEGKEGVGPRGRPRGVLPATIRADRGTEDKLFLDLPKAGRAERWRNFAIMLVHVCCAMYHLETELTFSKD